MDLRQRTAMCRQVPSWVCGTSQVPTLDHTQLKKRFLSDSDVLINYDGKMYVELDRPC